MTAIIEGPAGGLAVADELAVAVDAAGLLPLSPTDVAQFIRLEQSALPSPAPPCEGRVGPRCNTHRRWSG